MIGEIIVIEILLVAVLLHISTAVADCHFDRKVEDTYIITYHKTGNAFVTKVFLPSFSPQWYTNCLLIPFPQQKTIDCAPESPCNLLPAMSVHGKVARYIAPILVKDWSDAFPSTSRFIHFQRDPYEWSISHFQYHRRGDESHWTSTTYKRHACEVTLEISEMWDVIGLEIDQLMEVKQRCENIMGDSHFFYVVKSENSDIGLIFAAISMLIGTTPAASAEFTLAAYNSMQLSQLRHSEVVFMDTDVTDENNRLKTFRRLLSPYYEDNSAELNRQVELLDKRNNATLKTSTHGTHNEIDATERNHLFAVLNNDTLLKPILDKLLTRMKTPPVIIEEDSN